MRILEPPQESCACEQAVVTKYQKRISGRILDRIDIHIEVLRAEHEKWRGDRFGKSSEAIRIRVQPSRNRQPLKGKKN